MKALIIIFALLLPSLLTGCAGVVLGGAATGVVVAHDRRSTGTFIDDQELQWKLSQALYEDKEINANAHINITVYNSRVLLSGEAPTEELKIKANAIAVKTKRVTQVFNEISIESPSSLLSRSNDTYITGKIKIRLLDVPRNIDLTHIKVVTENSTVFLMGLPTREEAYLATEKVRHISGVKKVIKLFEYLEKPPKTE